MSYRNIYVLHTPDMSYDFLHVLQKYGIPRVFQRYGILQSSVIEIWNTSSIGLIKLWHNSDMS
jgi:hypothetical protein